MSKVPQVMITSRVVEMSPEVEAAARRRVVAWMQRQGLEIWDEVVDQNPSWLVGILAAVAAIHGVPIPEPEPEPEPKPKPLQDPC